MKSPNKTKKSLPIHRIIIGVVGVLVLIWLILARPSLWPFGKVEYVGQIVSPQNLKDHVRKLSVDLAPRSFRNRENLNLVADYIKQQLQKSGGRTDEQVYRVGTHDYRNIISEYGPTDGKMIVVGAHYDGADSFPAADDNASGVAGLIELGKLLGHEKLTKRIVLVAFTLEEPPFFRTQDMGSAVYVKALRDAGEDVELMISLEMIGYYSDAWFSQDYPMPLLYLFYPTKGNFITVVDRVFSTKAQKVKGLMSDVMTLPVYSINAPTALPGIDFSDHRNFWLNDYPAVMITNTAFNRNKAYHTSRDTYDRLDYEKMAEVVHGVYNTITNSSD